MRTLIPCNILHDLPDALILKETIQQNIPKIAEQLVGDLSWYSQNARLVPESVKIISIDQISALSYKMTYQFDWNIFNPCLDIDSSETTVEKVHFQLIPGFIAFELVDNQFPSTANEL